MAEKIDKKRLKAIEYAFWAGKLMDPKYFNKATKAIEKKDKKALLAVANEAGIPKSVFKQINLDYATEGWGWGWGSD